MFKLAENLMPRLLSFTKKMPITSMYLGLRFYQESVVKKEILCIVVLLVCCKNQSLSDEVSGDKFSPFALSGDFADFSLLINHVRASDLPEGKLSIAHSYIDCSFSDKAKENLHQATVDMIDIWLTPLRALDADIVKKENIENILISSSAKNYKLEIFWHCNQKSRSHALIKHPSTAKKDRKGKTIPWLNMYYDARTTYQGNHIAETKFLDFHLLHELGHAFGLADTYVALSKHLGQPTSVMASEAPFLDQDNNLTLADDDARGMEWLYHYYLKEERTDCIYPDYELIESSGKKVCKPKNALLETIKRVHLLEKIHRQYGEAYVVIIRTHLDNYSKDQINFLDNEGNNLLHHLIAHVSYSQKTLQQGGLQKDDVEKLEIIIWFRLNLLKGVFDCDCVDVNQKNNVGFTPLHIAAMLGNTDAVKLLLKHKATTTIEDNTGKTALDYARNFNHAEIVSMLNPSPN